LGLFYPRAGFLRARVAPATGDRVELPDGGPYSLAS
jgi:hypothetical protein